MLNRRIFAATLFLVSTGGAALAAATQEEADRIKAGLQAYLGSEPGVVAVAVQGEDYVVTLDATPYIAKAASAGFSAKVDPVLLTLRPKGNGQWDVSQSGPFAFSVNAEGTMSMDGKIASQRWNGVFDEASASFLTSTFDYRGITINQVVTDPGSKMKTTGAAAYESWSGTTTATARADGAVDSSGTMTITGVTSASKTELPPDAAAAGMPSFDYTVLNAKTTYVNALKGLRSRAVLDLIAWFVAHPAKDLIIKDQAQLKEKVVAALPLWDSLDTSATMEQTSVSTSFGQFALPAANFGVTMNGISKDGKLREAFGFTGLTIPPGIAPPWTDGLVPTDFNLDFTLDGVDLEAPVKLFINQADLAKDPPVPPGSHMLYLPAFAPKNTIGLSLQNGLVASPVFNVVYDADFTINLAGLPTGKANIRIKGLDNVMAKVQAAALTDPSARQAMGGIVALRGFGKAEADGTLAYAIEMTADAKLLVNGIDVSAMAGMAPPPPAQ